MGDNTLFFYGTLLAPPVLHRVIYGTSTPTPETHPAMTYLQIRPALLRGYRRHRVAYADYPAIVPEAGGIVRGSVVSGLTQGDVYRLDIFEGSQYGKKEVQVEVLEGVSVYEAAPVGDKQEGQGEGTEAGATQTQAKEKVAAQTYVWSSSLKDLDPQEWDFEDFKNHKMRRWMGDATWADDEDENENVQVDEGFADVDKAVEEIKAKTKDPTGGRGANGAISKQLAEVQRNGNGHATTAQ